MVRKRARVGGRHNKFPALADGNIDIHTSPEQCGVCYLDSLHPCVPHHMASPQLDEQGRYSRASPNVELRFPQKMDERLLPRNETPGKNVDVHRLFHTPSFLDSCYTTVTIGVLQTRGPRALSTMSILLYRFTPM